MKAGVPDAADQLPSEGPEGALVRYGRPMLLEKVASLRFGEPAPFVGVRALLQGVRCREVRLMCAETGGVRIGRDVRIEEEQSAGRQHRRELLEKRKRIVEMVEQAAAEDHVEEAVAVALERLDVPQREPEVVETEVGP